MRYLILTYVRKPSGKMDEAVEVSRRVRTRDLQTASVILDFQDRRVVKASLDGTVVPKDFDRIVSYYQQYYRDIIDQLIEANSVEKSSSLATDAK
jgi:hypothetical protein